MLAAIVQGHMPSQIDDLLRWNHAVPVWRRQRLRSGCQARPVFRPAAPCATVCASWIRPSDRRFERSLAPQRPADLPRARIGKEPGTGRPPAGSPACCPCRSIALQPPDRAPVRPLPPTAARFRLPCGRG
jgi:hypothetical protein